jgi:hypothetical protein
MPRSGLSVEAARQPDIREAGECTIRDMPPFIPGLKAVRDASREFRGFMGDSKLLGVVATSARAEALGQPVGSNRQQTALGLYRGYVGRLGPPGSRVWSFVKRRQLPDLPGEVTHREFYGIGFAVGEFLATVMYALAMRLRHTDLSDITALVKFATYYANSTLRDISMSGGQRTTILEWIRDPETLFRAHSAAAYDAETGGYGVGEQIEQEFLRALAQKTATQMPTDAEALIAERRRDSKNLPSGIEWSHLPKPRAVGGPTDGAGGLSVEAARELRSRVEALERRVILDRLGDGAPAERGFLAGLTASGRVPLLTTERTDLAFHQGQLGGNLDLAMLRTRGEYDVPTSQAAAAYARALVAPRNQAFLREPAPDGLLKADALARHSARQRVGSFGDADALAFFIWLAEQADVPVTPAVLATREHFIVRAININPDEPPDPQGRPDAD